MAVPARIRTSHAGRTWYARTANTARHTRSIPPSADTALLPPSRPPPLAAHPPNPRRSQYRASHRASHSKRVGR
eukprot:3266109-Rhodomonas_salina.1